MPQLRRSAPYALLNTVDATTVWGRLQVPGATVKLATVWGAAGRTGEQVTVWCSDPAEASRLVATGQPSKRRGGLAGLFGSRVVVERKDLTDSDVVLAVLLALHPRGVDEWAPEVLPQRVQTVLARTAITRRREDGTPWRVRDHRDADAVAALVCAMAEAYRADPGAAREEQFLALAGRLPSGHDECVREVESWKGSAVAAA